MNLLKLSFFSVVFLFIIISSIGILLPSTVLVSRATNILATKDSILGYIKNIEEWKEWIEGMQQTTVKIISPTCADLAGTTVAGRAHRPVCARHPPPSGAWTAGHGRGAPPGV